MSQKTRSDNQQEDEFNQARYFAEHGADVNETEVPGDEGPEVEQIELLESENRGGEQPPGLDVESEIADQSPFYGQGFGNGDDTGIRRGPKPTAKADRASLGG